ncbi:hypothetical protein GS538_09095 [Rhodococcus hoagii]|nr:hypothetical protein [Prescottella equi]
MLVTLISALLMLAGGGVAFAECASADGNSAGGTAAPVDASTLPEGFPADLRQFVAGTDEFRSGPWFSGVCATKGGDLGAYITAAFGQEDRLMWWADPENKGKTEPPHDDLPKVFPYDDPAFKMPTACADDLKSFATESSSGPWGFDWAAEPDSASVDAMITAAAEYGSVPSQAWSKPCDINEGGGMYCAHAFFVDCSKATNASSLGPCTAWNQSVGKLFGGTANWVDKNTSFTDRLSDRLNRTPIFKAGKWVLNFDLALIKGAVGAAGAMVAFVADPTSFAGKWANDFKTGAVDMSTKVLQSMTCSNHFDPASPSFRSLYAASFAFGMLVMAFMAVFTVVRSGYRGSPKELAESLFQYLPMGLFLSAFVPALAALILGVTEAATEDTAKILGQSTGKIIADVTAFGAATADNFLGGAIGGMILFAILALAALLLWIGLQIHQYGIPLSLVATAISLGMMVSPKYRKKALGPVFVFLGLALSVPLLFLLLAVVFGTADGALNQVSNSAMGTASQVLFVAIGMMLAAAAPWALLKWAPVLPTKADSEDFGGSGPGLGSEAVGAAGNYMMYGRGGGGKGVGDEQPAQRADINSHNTQQNGVGMQQSGQQGPMQSAYHERSDLSSAGQHAGQHGGQVVGGKPGVHGSGEMAGFGRAGGGAAAKGAAGAGGTAAAGAASGGVLAAGAIAAQVASAAITKAKSAADSAAPEADN